VTGSRAEYGLLRWVVRGLRDASDVDLQLIATGTHLSPEFGLTHREIEEDGIRIDRRIEMLLSSDTSTGIAKSMGLAMIGFADAYEELAPELVLVLGDRFEILAAAAAAAVARIPIAHLHGGEATEGSVDDAMRHAITKLAHLHFVAAEPYRRRIIQLGEDPARVFLVGGLGVDSIKKLTLLDRARVESALGLRLSARSLLVTFHPATLGPGTASDHMSELLAALDLLHDTQLIFTMPNADTESRAVKSRIEAFVVGHTNARAFSSLGQQLYLSCLRQVDGVVGNSSSGLIEAPSMKKGTINIGDRQRGRLKASSVIDCEPERGAIAAAIQRLYSPAFQAGLSDVWNPYGDGGASDRVVDIVRTHPLDGILKKTFYDVPDFASAKR